MASPMNENIVMVFATNMLDLLDPAFLRSGRCDFKIEVPLPDFECRKGILELNSKNRPLADDVDFDKIVKTTTACRHTGFLRVERIRCSREKDLAKR